MMDFIRKTHSDYNSIADFIFSNLQPEEIAQVALYAEETLFIRFNNNLVRQSTHVHQKNLTLVLQKENRQIKLSFPMTGQSDLDIPTAEQQLNLARQQALQLPEDTYIVKYKNNGKSEINLPGKLLENDQVVFEITKAAQGTDFAGLYCAGPMIAATRSSEGESHWFSTESFFVDFSLYNKEIATKGLYAGREWSSTVFSEHIRSAERNLSLLNKPVVNIKPGAYRTYLAPGAVADLAGMFSWGATSFSAYKQGRSSLQKLAEKEKSFSPLFSMRENFSLGLRPQFNSLGEFAAEKLSLIENGSLKSWQISSRSAKEYLVEGNFADPSESPRSLEILPGSLGEKDILKELGTGLYLSNLYYLNWSDRPNARITGMTRYACFWVENGEVMGPINDLRFDESLYDALGANLLAVTNFQHIETKVGTYARRPWGGAKVPGMLIKDFKFTL